MHTVDPDQPACSEMGLAPAPFPASSTAAAAALGRWLVLLALSCAALSLAGAGCLAPKPAPLAQPLVIEAGNEAEFEALWEAAIDVLRRHRFRIDREDLRARVITTYPETSQQWFEFWRHDVDTGRDLAEAQLHTVRRSVTVRLVEDRTPPQEYRLEVAVLKERQHAPERQVTNAAAALRAFSPEVPTTQGRRVDPEQDIYWTEEGRDPAMEARLAALIAEEYGG